ncbi:MAG: hypothetical protein JWP44_2794 [Mucilaginibacter sp.]|nr:hypothetical protein [Mucilaginibacter sp.]
MNSNQQVDVLVQGIKSILSKNRHSLLESEQETLTEAIQFLECDKKENVPKKEYGKLLMQALGLVARFFIEDHDKFKDLF